MLTFLGYLAVLFSPVINVGIQLYEWEKTFASSRFLLLRKIARLRTSSEHGDLHLALNPEATSPELFPLISSENQYVRSLLARHPNSDESILRTLALDPALMVRKALLHNPHTPGDVSALIALENMVR